MLAKDEMSQTIRRLQIEQQYEKEKMQRDH